jgi:hypothetical protein
MKRALIIAVLMIAGCGQEKQDHGLVLVSSVNTSGTTQTWSGYPHDENKPAEIQFDMAAAFDDMIDCLVDLGVTIPAGEPHVVVVKGWFYCGPEYTVGCYEPETTTIFLGNNGYLQVFEHEVVHWATGLMTDGHDSIYFSTCGGL